MVKSLAKAAGKSPRELAQAIIDRSMPRSVSKSTGSEIAGPGFITSTCSAAP